MGNGFARGEWRARWMYRDLRTNLLNTTSRRASVRYQFPIHFPASLLAAPLLVSATGIDRTGVGKRLLKSPFLPFLGLYRALSVVSLLATRPRWEHRLDETLVGSERDMCFRVNISARWIACFSSYSISYSMLNSVSSSARSGLRSTQGAARRTRA
jgi:hypothetical protein